MKTEKLDLRKLMGDFPEDKEEETVRKYPNFEGVTYNLAEKGKIFWKDVKQA